MTDKVPYGVSPSMECYIPLPDGGCFVFDGVDPDGTTYVRVLDKDGGEVAYWSCTEWGEEPVEVMGAICGAMLQASGYAVYYQFAPDVEFPLGVAFTPYVSPGDQK